jgi:hypothetical protein
MKNQLQSIPKPVLKGSLILICYFFLAACMQHDESLAPNKRQNDLLLSHSEKSQGVGSLMKNTFVAHLQGDNEIPPIDTQAQGQVIFKLSDDGQSIEYKVILANIEDVFAAHIHCGDALVPRGSVLVDLFISSAGPVDVNGVVAEGVITQASIKTTHATCPEITTFEQLVELMRSGEAYVNAHTGVTPSGAIRGQIH